MLGCQRLEPDDPAVEDWHCPPLHGLRQYTRRMPIYEYACMECESHFEELVRSSDQAVTCPECGAAKVLKQFSTFAVHGASEGRRRLVTGATCQRGRLLRRLLRLRLARIARPNRRIRRRT